jgi:CSLREA domain-containing protein
MNFNRRSWKKHVRHNRRRNENRRRSLWFEPLEDRRVLATITVTSLDDNMVVDGQVTLREAIEAANSNKSVDGSEVGESAPTQDVIVFAEELGGGTILLNSIPFGFPEPSVSETVRIEGPGQDRLTIDAQQNRLRVLTINATSGNVTVSGLTLTGGTGVNSGGGIYFQSSGELTVENSTISGNDSIGVLSRFDGTIVVTNSVITANANGGIWAQGAGNVTVSNSTISNNQSGFIGGIRTDTGSITVTNSTISGNSATNTSGGGVATSSGEVIVTGSTIAGNSAQLGGGIKTGAGPVTVTNSTISGNTGGGILTQGQVTLTNNSKIIGNTSGDGIFARGAVIVKDSTIADNSAGQGIDGGEGDVMIDNSIISRNSGGIHTSATAASGNITVTNSTISDNTSAFFGGINSDNGDVVVTNSKISRNTANAQLGGGISTSGAVTVIDSTISDNTAPQGGGISGGVGQVTVRNSTISGNTAGQGGGINAGSGGVMVTNNSILSDNTSTGAGGAISASNGVVSVTDSTISGNSSSNDGGGIRVANGGLVVTNTTVSNNTSATDGGGISSTPDAHVTVINSTISGNSANNGGGIAVGGTVESTIINSTITANSATNLSGGIHAPGNFPLTIRNSIVAGNSGTVANPDFTASNTAGNLTVTNSLIGDNAGTMLDEAQSADANGNLIGNPTGAGSINPRLGPLRLNGGLIATHALLSGSPAIDAGNNDQAKAPGADGIPGNEDDVAFTTDQRGLPFARIAAGNGNAKVDMGAYERQVLAPEFFIVTTAQDVMDDNDGVISLREAINAANGSVGLDETITFDVPAEDQPIQVTLGELVILDTVTIRGLGQDQTAIDAGQNSRVFRVAHDAGDVTFDGLTIRRGQTTAEADGGGGILFDSTGTLSIINSTISENSTVGDGATGGGIFASAGIVSIANSTISGNSTTGDADGGGIAVSSAVLTVANSTISGNSSEFFGGGIIADGGTVTITSSTLSGNEGGGIVANGGSVAVTNSTISGNVGSGIFAPGSGALTITNSTITENTASTDGGGIALVPDQGRLLTIRNSIIAGNTAPAGTNPDFTAPDNPNTNLVVTHSLIGDNTGTSLPEAQTADASGNLIGIAVADLGLGPLQDNGGPTLTHALLPGSLATDAGDNAHAMLLTTDQRGATFARIVDGGLGAVDMGAFERQKLAPASFVVTTALDETEDNGTVSLREAINASNISVGIDTITFAASLANQRINLTLGELVIEESAEITGLGRDKTIIDAQQNSRVLRITRTAADITLDDLTLTRGQTTAASDGGGGIRFDSTGTLSIINSTISENSTVGDGATGGGILASAGVVNIVSSTILGNSTTGDADGGGIAVLSAVLTVANSTISGNSSEFFGGGIIADGGTVTITSSTLSGNEGGGIVANGGSVAITNSTLSGNVGSGIFAPGSGALTITNSTITKNTASTDGGGIALVPDQGRLLTIRNSIVAGNTAPAGTDPDFTAPDNPNTNLVVTHSLIGDNTGTSLTEARTVDTNGNLIGDSSGAGIIAPLLGPLQDNGGPTFTHALLPRSPAIDGGDNAQAVDSDGAALEFDQRGTSFPRFLGSGSGAATVDMGAYEYLPPEPMSFLVTTNLDVVDDADGLLSLREAITAANRNLIGDTISFDPSLANQPINLTLGELVIDDAVTITGLGANRTTIDARRGSRVFDITNLAGDVTLDGLTLTGGLAAGAGNHGGAVRFASPAALTINQSTIHGNAADHGGGVYASAGVVAIHASTISGNFADQGGGVSISNGVVTITNSTISGNSADYGGGIYAPGIAMITNSTITENFANEGGGIGFRVGEAEQTLFLRNAIVAGNVATRRGSDISLPDELSTFWSVVRSLVGDNAGTKLVESPVGNIVGSSTGAGLIDPLLGPLQYNGGSTKTHALLPGSPAIDAGDNAIPADVGDFDQRGTPFTRIVDAGSGRATVDMGAFEFSQDFGDLPDPTFPTLLANNGARHTLGALLLGTNIDAEPEGQPDAEAGQGGSGGDDNNSTNDDDGVRAVSSFVATAGHATQFNFSVLASGAAKLDAWLDFNHNGAWNEANEQIFASTDVVAGTNILSFTVPGGAIPGDIGARFRLSSSGGLAPTGSAPDGEVEDYVITLLDGDTDGGAEVAIRPPMSGELEVFADGNEMVVRNGTTELFRTPGSALRRLNISGTAGDDTINIANLDAIFSGFVGGDAGLGNDTLRLVGGGQHLDLTSIANGDLRGFETIDIAGSSANVLTLNVNTVINLSTTTDTLRVRHGDGDTVNYGGGWTAVIPQIIDGQYVHVLTQNNASVEVVNTAPFRNPLRPLDSNRDGHVSPLDALIIINRLNTTGPESLATPTSVAGLTEFFYIDTNGDRFVAPIDVLQVINSLNEPAFNTEGEGQLAIARGIAFLDPLPQDSLGLRTRRRSCSGAGRAIRRRRRDDFGRAVRVTRADCHGALR